MVLLARVAERLYWAARYVERAEDTARVIRAYHDLVVDFPGDVLVPWAPLVAITGATALPIDPTDPSGERNVMTYLLADRSNSGSITSTLASARENLRTTREVLPREVWQAMNALTQYADAAASGAVHRQLRDRFLARVIDDSRRLDGVIESCVTRDHAYQMLRLGRMIERADMTTRVLGVRAASLLQAADDGGTAVADDVQWMGVLRSLSALQMYQRATSGPIDAEAVVRFLLFHAAFPRSVQSCLDEARSVLLQLPDSHGIIGVLDQTQTSLADCHPIVSDGAELDDAMDRLQLAIADVGHAIGTTYFDSGA